MAARDLLVRVLGDTRDVEAAFARSSRAATSFGASVDTTGKKADRAAKGMTSFAKGAAAGFGGAIAFNAGIAALRNVIGAASEAQQVLGQTRVALESTGKSWQQYGDRIEDAIASQSRLGFDDEALLRTFSLFIRQSRDVEEAIRRNSIAMNLARARFIDLEQAANLVNKAALGQAGALRRVGIDARNGASGVELLAQLERQFAGAAEDASNQAVGATDRLKVSLENVQESLGSLLIPKVTELADVTSDAADKTQVLVDTLGRLASVKIPPIRIPLIIDTGGGGLDLGDVFGEAKDAFQRGAETQFPGLKFVNDLVKLIKGQPNPNTKAAADAYDAKFDTFLESLEGDIDKSTKRANAKLKAFGEAGFKPLDSNDLGARLQSQFDATVAALQLQFDKAQVTTGAANDLAVLAELEKVIQARIKTQGRTTELMRELFQVQQQRAGVLEGIRQQQERAKQSEIDKVLGQLGFAVDRSQLTSQLSDDLAALKALAAGLRTQVARGGDVLDYQRQLVTVTGQIADVQREIAENSARVAQQRQFRALGLSASGGDVIPGVENLRKQLEQLTKRLGPDLTGKMRSQLSGVAKVLKGQFGSVTEESREAIRDLFKTIRDTFDKESNKEIAPRRIQVSDKIMTALGFDQDEKVKAFRAAQQFTKTPSFPTGARPFGVTAPTSSATLPPLHIHVEVDGEEIGNVLIRDLQKRAARTTGTARGRHAGKGLGLG